MGRVVALSLTVLLASSALAGCTLFDREDAWRLDVTLGVLLGESDGYPLDDVADAVEVASRQMEGAGYGLRLRIVDEAAGSDPAAAFDRLVDAGAAAVVAAVAPEDAQSLVERAAAKRRPLLLATPSSAPLHGDVSYTIQVAQDPRAVGAALAALAEREGAQVPLLFHARDPYVALVVEGFTGAWNGSAPRSVLHRIGAQGEITGSAQGACNAVSGDAPVDAIVVLSRADEAGWATRGFADGGCKASVEVLAGPSARGPALIEEAGKDQADRAVAGGVIGVEPARSRMDAFRSLFEAETGRVPGPYANEAYDAAIYVVLASFASKGNAQAEPVRATITAADLQGQLLAVASAPGIQHQELSAAIEAAQAGDELDWPGYAHDDAFTERRQPVSSSFAVWRVSPAGGFQSAGTIAP